MVRKCMNLGFSFTPTKSIQTPVCQQSLLQLKLLLLTKKNHVIQASENFENVAKTV